MLDSKELLEKLNANPNVEPWFKETLSRIIPGGFQAIAEMIGEQKTQRLISKTTQIVEKSIMHFEYLSETEKDSSPATERKTMATGTWNGGFIKYNKGNLFTGAFKVKNGEPNFVGELKVAYDWNEEIRVGSLIHEFFGHLVAQVIEPQRIGDKAYAIDGFYMDELNQEGISVGASDNRVLAEGLAELVSLAVAEKLEIPYQVSSLYANGCRAAKILCLATKNKALEYNFEGTPYLLQRDMEKVIGENSWKKIENELILDYFDRIEKAPEEYNLKFNLSVVQQKLGLYSVSNLNMAEMSADKLYEEQEKLMRDLFYKDDELAERLREVAISKYINAKLAQDYSQEEKVKHMHILKTAYENLDDIREQYNNTLFDVFLKVSEKTISAGSARKIFKERKTDEEEQRKNILNTTISSSEDIEKRGRKESIIFARTSSSEKISFLEFSDQPDIERHHMRGIYRQLDINLTELKNLDETSDFFFNKYKEQLYAACSADSKVSKFIKIKFGKIRKNDIPENYIFEPKSSSSIFLFVKNNNNGFDIYHAERDSNKKLRKLEISSPQKLGENERKRDLSFICPKTEELKTHQKPVQTIHNSIGKEAQYTR